MNGQETQNAYCHHSTGLPVDKIELGEPIKQLDDEDLAPHQNGKAVWLPLPFHRFSKTRNLEGVIRGLWVGCTGLQR